jgi:hypothetical protein
MASAALEWIDAETPHAKVARNAHSPAPARLLAESPEIRAAVARIEEFQARLTRESMEQPLVVPEIG